MSALVRARHPDTDRSRRGDSVSVDLAELSLAAPVTTQAETATARTSWGDPDIQGEWTSEGEYGVPLEATRPADGPSGR